MLKAENGLKVGRVALRYRILTCVIEVFIIIEYMVKKPYNKIVSAPTLHGIEEKSKIKSMLKKLIHY